MPDYKYLNLFPTSLKDSIIQNRCLPIIGSGFSLNAKIPVGKKMLAWEDLGRAFANEMTDYVYSNAIDAISAYEYAYSRPIMAEKMKNLLLTGYVKPSETHEAFCNLPFDIVCTTNFDHLLEDGYRKISKPFRSIVSESQLSVAPINNELTLLKFHGDIDLPDKIVATEEDYDKFLDLNPMLATFFSNLLITRTPLFIGYSLDDDDFRQIWQIIKNRLGKMVRKAYVIKINCSDTEKYRYERRGVNVINLPDDTNNYPQVLTDLFKEIKTYWDDNLETYGENSSLSELALPKGSQTRLCFFSAPFEDLSYYKDVFFPIAIKYGFTPITADAVISSSDNWMAKVSSLISKIDYFVVDISSPNTKYEFIQILIMNKKRDNILVIDSIPNNIPKRNSYEVITKEKDFFENQDTYIHKVENWFKKISEKLNIPSYQEPERLLEKCEFRAAVISAVVLLEVVLRKRIEKINETLDLNKGLYELARIAFVLKIINEADLPKIRRWAALRNRLVHTFLNIEEQEATETVNEITSFTNNITE